MIRYIAILSLLVLASCKPRVVESTAGTSAVVSKTVTPVLTDDFHLYSSGVDKALLIVFPGGGSSAEDTKEEFRIVEAANVHGIAVLLMNFTNRLWIEEEDCKGLSKILTDVVAKYNLPSDNVCIGGMSLGGTIALTMSDFMIRTKAAVQPREVFVVDSPFDLYALYQSSRKDVKNSEFTEERLAEPKWIINYFEEQFGGSDSLLKNIQELAPFTLETRNVSNLLSLKDRKLRFYTEPDAKWWMENRQTDFESTNAYNIIETNKVLDILGWQNVELIQTSGKGYRSNGDRHPHSWSIVDVDDLIKWIQE